MFFRTIGIILFFVFVATITPVSALIDKELEEMPLDKLTALEIRLKKILEIRKLESSIIKTQADNNKPGPEANSKKKGFGMDSTSMAPKLITNADLLVEKVKPVPVPRPRPEPQFKREHKPIVLPKITSIWGDVEKGLMAELEINNGLLTVKKGDKIFSDLYTVTAITGAGVTVTDKKGKSHPLAFKPVEKITQKTSIIPQPVVPTSFGQNSVFLPPLPGQK